MQKSLSKAKLTVSTKMQTSAPGGSALPVRADSAEKRGHFPFLSSILKFLADCIYSLSAEAKAH